MPLNFKKILKGALVSIILSAVFMFILAIFVFFMNISDRTVSTLILAFSALSVFIGAFWLAKNVPCKGMLNGLMLAGIYFAVLFIASVTVNGSVSADACNIMRLCAGSAAGMLGGILGINSGGEAH